MKRPISALAAFGSALLVIGCSSGQVGQLPTPTGPPSSSFKLQFAVGTATIGRTDGTTQTGLNVVATFRQSSGQNATETNTPTLSGPANFAGASSVSGYTLPQMQAMIKSGMPGSLTSFGGAIGVFGYGFGSFNYQPPSVLTTLYAGEQCQGFNGSNQPDGLNYNDLNLPLSFSNPCQNTGPPVAFTSYYGGSPAWPSPQGYGIPAGFIGFPLGFMDFDDVTPVKGSYGLNVAYPDTPSGTHFANVTASANLTNLTPLPAFATPTLAVQSDGSAIVSVNVPPGVLEAIVTVQSVPCLKNSDGTTPMANRYALLTRQPGPQELVISNALGAPLNNGSTPTTSFCTAATDAEPNAVGSHSYLVDAVGFDYPAFEASYPQSTSPTPAIANAAGQADITTANPSAQINYTTSTGTSVRRPR